ncbi:MAG: hypothetical protein JXA52_08840 [Planctomycetes bacterium]|nr:hypothetical protein [Planctomycetota bacterium]
MLTIRRVLILTAIFALLAVAIQAEPTADLADGNTSLNTGHWWANGIRPPMLTDTKTFNTTTNTDINFIYKTNVTGWGETGGLLQFTLTSTTATLGWGNYKNYQDLADVEDMFQERNDIIVRIKGNNPASTKKLESRLYGNGSVISAIGATVSGTWTDTGWHEVTLAQNGGAAYPSSDGFELKVTGASGETFQIEWVKLEQQRTDGYVRNEFTLPAGTVWRAIAEVGGAPDIMWYGKEKISAKLFINGQEIDHNGNPFIYHANSIDITPYLQTGANCIGLSGYRVSSTNVPCLYFQCRIIMADGTELEWDTDLTNWKGTNTTPPANWCEPGFSETGWTTAASGYPIAHWQLGTSSEVAIASYMGPIDLRNPDPNKINLFYEQGTDVVFDVYIPEGLKTPSPNPVLKYWVRVPNSDGTLGSSYTSGQVSSFAEVDNSLKYTINLGNGLPDAVYTISFELYRGTTKIKEREREPFVVVKNHSPTPIEGTSYEEGLTRTLEDTVNFWNPADGHPNKEYSYNSSGYSTEVTTPRYESLSDGSPYREVTGSERGSNFTYRFVPAHPGDFYMCELEYPDNDDRLIECSISNKVENTWSSSVVGVGVETGRTFFRTYKMQTLNWIFRAGFSGPHSIDIMNGEDNLHSAAQSLRMYHITGDLPAIRMGNQRTFGIQSERTLYSSGIGTNFGLEKVFVDLANPLMQVYIADLIWMKETYDHYVQYLKFAGQNMHIMGAYQYTQEATPSLMINHTKDSRIPDCYRAFLANVLEINDIDFYMNMEFCHYKGEGEALTTNAQVAQGMDTYWMINGNGAQNGGTDVTANTNWLHPDVQKKWLDFMTGWAKQYKQFTHFKGVHNEAGLGRPTSPWMPGVIAGSSTSTNYANTLSYSFDDTTFNMFEADTGINLGISPTDTDRFAARKTALTTALPLNSTWKAAFYQWRSDKYREFMEDTLDAMHAERADLRFLNDIFNEDNEFFKYWLDSGKEYEDIMLECGFDFDQLQAVPDLWTGRWTISFKESWRFGLQYSQSPYLWLAKLDPRIIDAYDTETNRYVFVRASWDENEIASAGYDRDVKDPYLVPGSDWIMKCYRVRTEPQPAGYQCREPIIAALISADPQVLVFGWTDLYINLGHEQKHRNFTKLYSQLPPEKFSPAFNTGFDTNVVVRKLVKGAETWIYVANPCYWPISASLTLNENSSVLNLDTNSAATLTPHNGNYILAMDLEPYGLAAYKLSSPTVGLTAYDTGGIPYAELEYLEKVLANSQTIMGLSGTISALSSAELAELNGKVAAAAIAIQQGQYAKAWKLLNELPVVLDLRGVDWKSLGYYDQAEPVFPILTQSAYNWAPDADVGPTSLSWQTQDTVLVFEIGDSQILGLQIIRDDAIAGGDYVLQYQEDYDTDTPGDWTDVATGNSWEPEGAQELNLSNNDNVDSAWYNLTPPPGYSSTTGNFSNDGVITHWYPEDTYLELWYSIKPAAAAEGHNYRFRIIKDGATVNHLAYAKAMFDSLGYQSGCAWAQDASVTGDLLTWQDEGTELKGLVNQTYHLAVQLSMLQPATGGWLLQYQEDYDTGTPGAWTDVTDSGAWRTEDEHALLLNNDDAVASSWYSISTPYGYVASAGEFSDDNDGAEATFAAGDYVELWYAITPRASAFNHTYRFRVVKDGSFINYPVYATADLKPITNFSFQQGIDSYAGTIDLNLRKSPALSYIGLLARIDLGQYYDPSHSYNGEYDAALIHFGDPNGVESMLASLSPTAILLDATLTLYITLPNLEEHNRVLEVSAVTDPNADGMWTENSTDTDASYRNAGTPWTVSHTVETLTPLMPGDAGDHGPEISNVTIPNTMVGFYDLDVTEIVQDWIDGEPCQGFHLNVGLHHPDGPDMWSIYITSSEGNTLYPELHPKLTVEFDPLDFPTAEGGPDLLVGEGKPVILDGSDSVAVDGKTIDSYQWVWMDGPVEESIVSVTPTAVTSFTEGVYEITHTVVDNTGRSDSDTFDLTCIIPIPGDIILDDKVDFADFMQLKISYNSEPGDPNWNPYADLDNSDRVDFGDFTILKTYYGTTR